MFPNENVSALLSYNLFAKYLPVRQQTIRPSTPFNRTCHHVCK